MRVVAWDLTATYCVDLQGDNSIEPTTANYTFKHVLENQHDVYEIDLCPSQLKAVCLPYTELVSSAQKSQSLHAGG